MSTVSSDCSLGGGGDSINGDDVNLVPAWNLFGSRAAMRKVRSRENCASSSGKHWKFRVKQIRAKHHVKSKGFISLVFLLLFPLSGLHFR